ncbi:MAG: DUF4388 domain-containing protein [Planctomycetota bacterium]|nr:DUF4388 domain-containing protein [Planctomycetota bacterium]
MVFSGDLSGISLPDVFQNLAGNRATGTLHVRWDKGERFVQFSEGGVTAWAPGPDHTIALLDHVAERGYTDPEAMAKVLGKARRRKRPARLLLSEGLIDAPSLQDAFAEIVAEGVYELVSLHTAQFSFAADDTRKDIFDRDMLSANLQLEVGPIILEGARRADEMQRIRNVIGSEQDLFVCDPMAVDRAPDDDSATVASVLDGFTDVAGVARLTQMSRFAVSCALMTLVEQGLARPATGEEIAAMAEQALADNHREDAIRLLGQALVRLPREGVLRRRLAETLAAAGRKRESAGEMAVLAFQLTEEERFEEALEHYDRAITLDPADVLLHQRKCAVLAKLSNKEALRDGVLQWVRHLESLGLAERACDVLTEHVDNGPLRHDNLLLLRLAELSKTNGNVTTAAARYVQIADLHGGDDPKLEVQCLRAALAAQPDDSSVRRRLHDLESGRTLQRVRRRRIVTLLGSAAAIATVILWAATLELSASKRLAEIMRDRPADTLGMTTLPALRELAQEHSWLPSPQLAQVIAGEEAMRLVRKAAELRLAGSVPYAITALEAALPSLPERVATQARQMVERLTIEEPLFRMLARVELRGRDDGEASQALMRATDPAHFEFHRDMLPRVRCDAARSSMLIALQQLDDPRAAAAIAEAWLVTRDDNVARLAAQLLARAAMQLPEATNEAIEPLLVRGRRHSESRARTEQLHQLLAAPEKLLTPATRPASPPKDR